MALKLALGISTVLCVWFVASIFVDTPIRPWLIGGTVLGLLLNGLWELCDVFGLKRVFGIDD
jgi:hypothetical protein